jgi:hypothetical protein
MKIGIAIEAGLFVLGVLLGIVELWFAPWTPQFFIKLEITIGALFAVVGVIWFAAREFRENKITQSGERLDDE